ncbi:MAG: hypothetical protein HY913_21165 [Desulfomonile tiedjei]|nr:hypothetical protein [Desulfomonile tiedjei]
MEEETDVRATGIFEGSVEFSEIEKHFRGEAKKEACYGRCMDDAWDLKGESTCSSACGF